jgi:preprotein translocase subunit SecA
MDVATEEMTQSQEANITKLAESIASLEQNAPTIESIVGASDYAKFALRKQKQLVKEYKVGRNDSCPCGSGKKYKHCCLKSGVYENYITK